MIALVSPAKTLDFETALPPLDTSTPRFAAEAATLARGAAKLSAVRLGKLMHISPKLAKLNADRFRTFDDAPERPAVRAFAGDVYTGFEAATLDEAGLAFANDHFRILSGLYGLLRPLDRIRPYRLEMGTAWAPGRAKDLYGWWKRQVSDALAEELASEDSATILNLASKEYWQVVAQAPPKGVRILTIDFRDATPNGLRFNTFIVKRARGAMARFLCEHRITDPEGLKAFDWEGHAFDADGSSEDEWRFVRG